MKKHLYFLLALTLFLSSCTVSAPSHHKSSSEIFSAVKENRSLLEECVKEMESFGLERIYVAIEKPKKEEKEEGQTQTETEEEKPPRLVSFEKESDERQEIENETLEKALRELDLELIFFQTASDSRRTVIFSFSRETSSGVQNGFYYSYDALPAGWWGRRADLKKQAQRYLQINQKGDAWYYTVQIQENFYYFEKKGSLLA